mgnify:CR=1 FL=1
MSQPQTAPAALPIPPRVQQLRALCLTLLLALIVLGAGWELWWAPVRPGGSTLFLGGVAGGGAVAGLLRHRLYTYRWLSLLVWLYVAEAGVRLWSDLLPLSRALAWGELFLSVALFISLSAYIRTRLKNGQTAS